LALTNFYLKRRLKEQAKNKKEKSQKREVLPYVSRTENFGMTVNSYKDDIDTPPEDLSLSKVINNVLGFLNFNLKANNL